MQGLLMDYELDVAAILRRGEQLFGAQEIASRLPDKTLAHATPTPTSRAARSSSRWRSATSSASSTATASPRSPGTTTSTSRPTSARRSAGFVTHTLNLRLHPDDLTRTSPRTRATACCRRQDAVAARRGSSRTASASST